MDKKLQEAYKNLELEFKRKNYNLKQQELQQNKEIAEKQIAAQDRVNISLTEYKNITNKISESKIGLTYCASFKFAINFSISAGSFAVNANSSFVLGDWNFNL